MSAFLSPIAFGIATGTGIQAWRQFPPDAGPITATSVAVLTIAAIVAAYLGGRTRRGAASTSVAVAEATAIAQNNVQVAVVMPAAAEQGAGSVGAAGLSAGAAMPWLSDRPAFTLDALDGLELSDASEDGQAVAEISDGA